MDIEQMEMNLDYDPEDDKEDNDVDYFIDDEGVIDYEAEDEEIVDDSSTLPAFMQGDL